jgi:hypothetical protein
VTWAVLPAKKYFHYELSVHDPNELAGLEQGAHMEPFAGIDPQATVPSQDGTTASRTFFLNIGLWLKLRLVLNSCLTQNVFTLPWTDPHLGLGFFQHYLQTNAGAQHDQ